MNLRYLAYRLVRSLLWRLVDPDLRSHAELIFAIAEGKVPRAIQHGDPGLVTSVLSGAVGVALAPSRQKPWHVEQLLDLYNPREAATKLLDSFAEGLEP